MLALIIGLEDSTRVGDLSFRLRSMGFDPQGIIAVDGRGMSALEISTVAVVGAGKQLYGIELSPPQIGCHLSHRAVYEKFLSTTHSWVLVCEDDAFPLSELAQLRQWIGTWVTTTPTVVECFSAGRVNVGRQVLETSGDLCLQRLKTFPGFTVAYFINTAAARLALEYEGRVTSRADWPQWATEVSFWRTQPYVVLHGGPGEASASTLSLVGVKESRPAKLARWLSLLSGITFLRLRQYYPGGLRQYYRHAVTPSLHYWLSQLTSGFRS